MRSLLGAEQSSDEELRRPNQPELRSVGGLQPPKEPELSSAGGLHRPNQPDLPLLGLLRRPNEHEQSSRGGLLSPKEGGKYSKGQERPSTPKARSLSPRRALSPRVPAAAFGGAPVARSLLDRVLSREDVRPRLSLVDRLDPLLLRPPETVLHRLELLRGMTPPSCDLALHPQRLPRAV